MKKLSLVLGFILVLFLPLAAKAGFGIVSPYIRNERLNRGAHYQKEITLVRGNADEDWKVELVVDVPGANNWFTIDKGTEFILPAGEKQTPVFISVDVPEDAEFASYKGTIRVRTLPVGKQDKGQITIALGGQIDVELDVVDIEIFDFKVWSVRAPDLEEGWTIWLRMEIENTGNIKSAPTKVELDIYDSNEENLLESVVNSNELAKVNPFETGKIIAEFPNKLKAGSYLAEFKIFKEEEIVYEGKIHISVLPQGSLPPRSLLPTTAKTWLGLALWLWLVIAGGIIVLAGIGFYLWKRKR